MSLGRPVDDVGGIELDNHRTAVGPSAWRMVARLCWVFSGFLFLDVLFWSVADFGKFMPPSPGPWLERADWALLTALGPISMMQIEALRSFGLTASIMITLIVMAAIRWRHLTWLRGVAYSGIVVWWLLGWGIGVIRIT